MKLLKTVLQTIGVTIISTAALAVVIACVRIAIYYAGTITDFVTGGFML